MCLGLNIRNNHPRQPRPVDTRIHVYYHDVGNNNAPAAPASPVRGQVDSQRRQQQQGRRIPDQRPRNETPNPPARGGIQDAVQRPHPKAAEDQKGKKQVKFADLESKKDDADKKRKDAKEEEIKVAEQKKRADKEAVDKKAVDKKAAKIRDAEEKEKQKSNAGRNRPGNNQKGNGRQQKPGRPAGGN